jgi:hypothetical protein
MSALMGLLGLNDSERVFVSTLGQAVVYEAIQTLVARYNLELAQIQSVFVERSTENFKERYKLPGGGRLQKMSGLAPAAEVKAYGGWDVGYPLEQFGAALGGSRISMAYMTAQDLDRHMSTVMIQDMNSIRFEILRRLFNNTERTFVDELHGSLLVEPIANGDSVLYPPVIGSEAEATENHMYVTGYSTASISATNNPCATIAAELEEHFGKPIGGSNIIAFFNTTAEAYLRAIAAFVEVPDQFVTPGGLTAVPVGLPPRTPGRIIGRLSGCWVSIWDWIPDGYVYAQHLGAPAPLVARYDPANTGLPRGLSLVARDERYPIETSNWEHRVGFGVGNRLNGVFLQFDPSDYTVPTGYTY